MNPKFIKIIALVFCCTFHSVVYAQSNSSIDGQIYRPISLDEYLSQVESNSGTITAKKLTVASVVAQQPYMSTPHIFPSFTYSRGSYYSQVPYTPYVSPGSNTYSLSGTIEGWGKRSARADYSAAEVQRNEAELNSIVKATRGDAAFAFLDTLRIRKLYSSYQVAIDKLNAIKAKTDAQSLAASQKNTANDLKYFAYTMGTFLSNSSPNLYEPIGDLEKIKVRDFKVSTLVEQAHSQRADILYFNEALKSADASLELAKKNRNINLSPSVWLSQTPQYVSSGTQYGNTQAYGFSVTMPIPTNLLFDGELVQEANNKLSLEAYLRDLKARASAEVNQALMQYSFAKNKLQDEVANYANTAKTNSGNSAKSIILMRDKEAELIDARINHAKALIYLLRVSGDYEIPKI